MASLMDAAMFPAPKAKTDPKPKSAPKPKPKSIPTARTSSAPPQTANRESHSYSWRSRTNLKRGK